MSKQIPYERDIIGLLLLAGMNSFQHADGHELELAERLKSSHERCGTIYDRSPPVSLPASRRDEVARQMNIMTHIDVVV